jgi:hypothetical protein
MDTDDLESAIEHGSPIEEAAQFLCRTGSVEDVERQAEELRLKPKWPGYQPSTRIWVGH